jgi:hypothetical protein
MASLLLEVLVLAAANARASAFIAPSTAVAAHRPYSGLGGSAGVIIPRCKRRHARGGVQAQACSESESSASEVLVRCATIRDVAADEVIAGVQLCHSLVYVATCSSEPGLIMVCVCH